MGTSIDLTKKVYIFFNKDAKYAKNINTDAKKKSKSKEKTKTKTKEGRGSCLNRPPPVGMVVTVI